MNYSLGKRKTNEQFVANVRKANGDKFTLLSEYHTNYRCKIAFRCNACGFEDSCRSDVLERGRNCKQCLYKRYSDMYTKSTEKYNQEVSKETSGCYVLTSEYTGVNNYIHMKHITCGKEYKTTPHQFNRGRRCPHCNASKGESLVKKVLETLEVPYKYQVNLRELNDLDHRYSYDFYLPDKRVLIEYQGKQHYEPVELFGGLEAFERQQQNDEYKRDFAKQNSYILIEVPYTEDTYSKVLNFLLDNKPFKDTIVSVK